MRVILLALLLVGCAKSPSPRRPLPNPTEDEVRNLDLDLGDARWERRGARRDVLVVPVTVRNLHGNRTLRLEPFSLNVRDRGGQLCAVLHRRALQIQPGDVARVQLRGTDCARAVDAGSVRLVGDVDFTFGNRDRILQVDERVEVTG